MIQLAHVATGALAGSRYHSPSHALIAGFLAHGIMDLVPHGEVHDDTFEATTAVIAVVAIALSKGLTAPVALGAIGSVLPDLEHVLPRKIRPRRAIYPTHRWSLLHGWETKPLAIPAWAQALVGGVITGAMTAIKFKPSKN